MGSSTLHGSARKLERQRQAALRQQAAAKRELRARLAGDRGPIEHSLTVVWDAGWDDLIVDPSTRRPMDDAELAAHRAYPNSPFIGVYGNWLLCSRVSDFNGIAAENEVVRITHHGSRGD